MTRVKQPSAVELEMQDGETMCKTTHTSSRPPHKPGVLELLPHSLTYRVTLQSVNSPTRRQKGHQQKEEQHKEHDTCKCPRRNVGQMSQCLEFAPLGGSPNCAQLLHARLQCSLAHVHILGEQVWPNWSEIEQPSSLVMIEFKDPPHDTLYQDTLCRDTLRTQTWTKRRDDLHQCAPCAHSSDIIQLV